MDDLEREIRAAVKSCRESLAFAAPEIHDLHWQILEERLIDILSRKQEDESSGD